MKPILTKTSNHSFGAPRGEEEVIGSLPCRVEIEDDGTKVIYSVWEPTDEDREAIASGGNIELGVVWIGGLPPISLNVTDEVEILPEDAQLD